MEYQTEHGDRLSREGLQLLRAWILSHVGRAREAWMRPATIDRAAFGPRYRAEYHFTRGVALCETGELEAAEREARAGTGAARRAASRGNALHVEARVVMAAKDDVRAIALLERARRHAYQGQAAPVLVHLPVPHSVRRHDGQTWPPGGRRCRLSCPRRAESGCQTRPRSATL